MAPDDTKVLILQFLDSHYASDNPIDGYDESYLAEELAIPEDQVVRSLCELRDRGFVYTGGASSSSPIGRAVISSPGKDHLHAIRDAPARLRSDQRTRFRRIAWDIARLALAAYFGALMAGFMQTTSPMRVPITEVFEVCRGFTESSADVSAWIEDELRLKGTPGHESQSQHRLRLLQMCREAIRDSNKQADCCQCYGTIVDYAWSTTGE